MKNALMAGHELIEISLQEYHLNTSTLFLTMHLLDQLLLVFPVKKYQFQLLGSGCLLVAAKLEEIQVNLILLFSLRI